MKRLAIIPARGGSKRIPNKNIKEFCGKPIIAYSIEAAINSGVFDEVMVSTDNQDIATIAESWGALVPFMRSKKTSDDFATTASVIIEVISRYRNKNINFDVGCCIYPTAPLVSPELLRSALVKMESERTSSIFSVTDVSNTVWRSIIVQNEKVQYLFPEFSSTRSQDLPLAFQDAGMFYFFNPNALERSGNLVQPTSSHFLIDSMHAQDIDDENDWRIAECKYKLLKGLE